MKDMNDAIELSSKLMSDLKVSEELYGSMIYLMRGSVWHYLYFLLSHGMAMDDRRRVEFLDDWKGQLNNFLTDCVSEVKFITSKSYPDSSDPWLWEAVN